MGKIVMPKNSAVPEEIQAALKIYYDENDWLKNDEFIIRLKSVIGGGQYHSSYTKKVQMLSYFGFTTWENLASAQSRRRITPSGKKFYEAWQSDDKDALLDVLMNSLEQTVFGRNNCGCSESDSDVEVPSVFIRASLQLEYLTYTEFAFLLWCMENCGMNYTDAVNALKTARNNNNLAIPEEAKKYADAKPIMMLVRWGFLSEYAKVGAAARMFVSEYVLSKYNERLHNLKIYNVDKNIAATHEISEQSEPENERKIKFYTGLSNAFERNRIVFGAPGTGKSYTLNKERIELLGNNCETDYERVTFHPDYSYANFVGTYKPVPCKGDDGESTITYEYVPGPFMRVYTEALKNGRTNNVKPFLLIVEEINRANVAAVFGDIFQLLDRGDNEVSEYPIQASEDIKKYLHDQLGGDMQTYEKIMIPDNMFIWATMNSADQGVFPMDTAFKRRWDFTYIGIDDSESGISDVFVTLGEGSDSRYVNWNELRKAINDKLASLKINEDKQLGPYFLSKKAFYTGEKPDVKRFQSAFKNKVLMYLFEDAAKQKKSALFAEEINIAKYSSVCKAFDKKGVFVFCTEISNRFTVTGQAKDADGENV